MRTIATHGRPRSLSVALVVAALLTAAPSSARRHAVQLPCSEGQFNVLGAALMDPTASDDAIMITPDGLTVTSGCGPTPLKVRRTKKGRMLLASWKYCLAGGAVRFRASFTTDCDELAGQVVKPKKQRHYFRAKRYQSSPDRDPGSTVTTTTTPDSPLPPGATTTTLPPPPPGTFGVISERIFAARGCTVAACHGDTKSGGLDLRPGAAYANLVNAPATSAPGTLRVKPGAAQDSFLSRKVRGQLSATEGSRMPLVGEELSVLERDLIDIWINAGAPETADVPGAPQLDPAGYRPVDPPPVPPGGVQLLLDGPMLDPGQETEGCLWVPAPNATDILISSTSVVANPGTHHVVVWRYTAGGTPQLNTWRAGDIACLSGAQLGTTGLAGAGMGNGNNTGLPPGVASVLPGGGYFGLNAHYYNEFDVPIQIKVWFNFFPYQGTPEHIVQSITSLDTTFGISVPAFTQRTRRGRYVNTTGRPMYFLNVGGHMHKRGLRFSAWYSNGGKVFDDYEWSHPVGKGFSPPYVLAPNDWFDYECLHDNGVTRPVRLDARGRPTTLVFGTSAEDEMCILVGSYYQD